MLDLKYRRKAQRDTLTPMYPERTNPSREAELSAKLAHQQIERGGLISNQRPDTSPGIPTLVGQLQSLLGSLVDIHSMQRETLAHFGGPEAAPSSDRDPRNPSSIDELVAMCGQYADLITKTSCVIRQRIGG